MPKQTNIRLPEITLAQIETLKKFTGISTNTTLITMSINFMLKEITNKESIEKAVQELSLHPQVAARLKDGESVIQQALLEVNNVDEYFSAHGAAAIPLALKDYRESLPEIHINKDMEDEGDKNQI